MLDLAHHQTEAVQLIFLGMCKSDIILIIVASRDTHIIVLSERAGLEVGFHFI